MGILGDEKRKGGGSGGKGGVSESGRPPGRGGKRLPKGQRTKKKTDVEFKDAHSGIIELAPPPSGRDIMAIPAKLRHIMNLKAALASGEKFNSNVNKRKGKDDSKTSKEKDKKRKLNDEKTKANEGESKDDLPPAKKSKISRAEEEIKMLNAKFDRQARVEPKSRGEKWKSYLNEKKKKKKKKKGKELKEEGVPAFHEHEKIEFGEVVLAPPKLSLPKKAAAIKEKEKADGDQTLLRERLRLQAIESYRQRKNWSERPGQKWPSLDIAVAVSELAKNSASTYSKLS